MRHLAHIAAAVAAGLPAGSQAAAGPSIPVPSGQPVTLAEVLVEEQAVDGPLVRFRFLAPRIAEDGGTVTPETAAADMDHLCDALALPYLAKYALRPSRIVISLSDRAVPFGKSVPEATQFFEAYRPEVQGCAWEEY